MTEIHLPSTHLTEHIIKHNIPLGQVHIDSLPGTTTSDPQPAGPRTVILPLYYAQAYPSIYYKHPVNLDITPIIDINL